MIWKKIKSYLAWIGAAVIAVAFLIWRVYANRSNARAATRASDELLDRGLDERRAGVDRDHQRVVDAQRRAGEGIERAQERGRAIAEGIEGIEQRAERLTDNQQRSGVLLKRAARILRRMGS